MEKFIAGTMVGLTAAMAGMTLADLTMGDLSNKAFDTIAAELPECAAEDSTNCYWDGAKRGNGKGESFVDIRGVALYRRD